MDDVMAGDCLGHSDHEMVEFLIFHEGRTEVNRTVTLGFQSINFGLFRRLPKSP